MYEWPAQQRQDVLRVRWRGEFALGNGQGDGGAQPGAGRGGEPVFIMARTAPR